MSLLDRAKDLRTKLREAEAKIRNFKVPVMFRSALPGIEGGTEELADGVEEASRLFLSMALEIKWLNKKLDELEQYRAFQTGVNEGLMQRLDELEGASNATR